MHKKLLMGMLMLMAASVIACAPQTLEPSASSATFEPGSPLVTRVPPDRPVLTPAPEGAGEAPEALVQQAIDDLMQRTGARSDEIEVVSSLAVTWSDSGLGCPKPGVDYLQVLTEGYRVVLKVAGREYDYHAGPSTIFLCERAFAPLDATPITIIVSPRLTPVVGGGGIVPPTSMPPGSASLLDQAKADLAARLAIDVSSIEVVSAESVEWSDSSLGCPREGMAYLQVIIGGTHIVLRVGDQLYSYHSGRGAPPFLCENPIIGPGGPGTGQK